MGSTTRARPHLPGEAALRTLGLDDSSPAVPRSTCSFPDGGLWRGEVPSVEGSAALDAAVEEAAPLNSAAFARNELLGADTVNVPSDLTLHQPAEIGAACSATIDFYVEAPDNTGGFVRHHEIFEITRAAAAVHVKSGPRNAVDIHPAGRHLQAMVLDSTRERVRRVRLSPDVLRRTPSTLPKSPPGSRSQPTPPRPAGTETPAMAGEGVLR